MGTEKAVKKQKGHLFKPGQSGNPSGRPPGALNQTTRAAQVLLAGEAENLTRTAVELALAGNVVALRLCLERIMPLVKSQSLAEPFVLPSGDLLDQVQAVLRQVADGEMSPTAAAEVVGMVATAAKVAEIDQLRNEVNSLKRVLEGRKKK